MIDHLETPMARAELRWRSAAEGGRQSGPPTAQVYAATCVFPLGADAEVMPDWPVSAEKISVLLERTQTMDLDSYVYDVDFLVRELAVPFVSVGAAMLVMEGPKTVGEARFLEVYPPQTDPSGP